MAWLAFMIAIEDDFKKSVKKGTLMRRFTRIVDPEFLLVFLAYLGLLILQGINLVTWLQWLLLLVELGLSAVCIWFTRSQRKGESDKIKLSLPH